MKNKIIYLLVTLVTVFCVSTLSAQKTSKNRYVPREGNKQSAHAMSFAGALEYYASIRNNQETKELNPLDYFNARKEVENLKSNKSNLIWNNIGPVNQGGRVRSIIFDRSNPNIMYAGAVSGGLWKTTNSGLSWAPINDLQENLAVTAIAQAPNGIIYYGTGEGFAPGTGAANGSTGFTGKGLFKSTDATGTTFVQIPSTDPTTQTAWTYVYKMAIHPTTGDIYVATHNGARVSKDEGATWTNPIQGTGATSRAHDVDISTDGNTIVLVVGHRLFISKDAGATFNPAPTSGTTGLPASGISRIEVDIAPSNPNIMYAAAIKTNETLHNVYRTEDGGTTWTIIGPGGSANFNPPGNQGTYNCVLKVHPTNPNKLFFGGIDKWSWELNGNWIQKSLWYASETSPYYLHADHHEYVYHPQNPNIIYYGTDGGISRSTDGGNSFHSLNRNFVTLQYYTLHASITGEIMGGTQDNGTLLMDRKGFIEGKSVPVSGGDGGGCAFSSINPDLIFSTVYYASLYRSPDKSQATMSSFYDAKINALSPAPGNPGFAAFVPPIVLHERLDDVLSPDSITFIATQNYNIGDIITVNSSTSSFPIEYQITSPLLVDDTLMIQDPISSRLYVGATGRILMTRESHNFSKTPEWHIIANITGTTQTMSVSNCGNYLFVGTSGGRLYRLSNLNLAYDSLSAAATSAFSVIELKELSIAAGSRAVTSIAIDPKNPARVVVTLGNYGNVNYVFMSTNALDAEPTFVSKQGNLPRMPVYSSIIDLTSPNTVILGTEFGIFTTTNIGAASPVWSEDNTGGIARVPVYALYQQTHMFPGHTNYGVIYAGSHGRGAFESFSLVPVKEFENNNKINSTLNVFPNPASDVINIELPDSKNAKVINVYNVEGRLVYSFNVKGSYLGNYTIDVANLPAGLYTVEVKDPDIRKFGKFIVIK